MQILTKSNGMCFAIIAAVWVWSLCIASSLPEMMPIHFDIHGQPNGYAPKYFALSFLPAISVFCLLVNLLVVRFSPACAQGPNARYLAMFETVMTLFLCTIQVSIVMEAQYPGRDIFANTIFPALSLLTIAIGNSMGKLQPNKFVGIRLPWTMKSEENWKRTHRFSGKLFVICGVLMFALSLSPYTIWLAVLIMVVMPGISIVYSYRLSKQGVK